MKSEVLVQVRASLKEVEAHLKFLKKHARESGHRISSAEYFSIRLGKDDATKYCTILAESHGRIHKQGMDPAEQKAFVEATGIMFEATGS
jgi:hypothetical protein